MWGKPRQVEKEKVHQRKLRYLDFSTISQLKNGISEEQTEQTSSLGNFCFEEI